MHSTHVFEKSPRLGLLALAAISLLSVPASATLSLYDGFNYTAGTNVPDSTSGSPLNGGTGWSTGWADVSPDSGANAYTVTNAGLSYGSLTVAGNALNRGNDNLGALRNFSAKTDGTYYFSCLLNLTDAASTYAGVTIGGAYFGSINSGGVRSLGIAGSYGSGTSALTSTQLTSTATTYFLVGKIDFTTAAGGDTISLWVNPVVSSEANAGSADAVNTSVSLTSFSQIAVYQSTANFNLTIDEIRLGTTWADVTVGLAASVPEPSSCAALLGVFGLGVAALRRRRG